MDTRGHLIRVIDKNCSTQWRKKKAYVEVTLQNEQNILKCRQGKGISGVRKTDEQFLHCKGETGRKRETES